MPSPPFDAREVFRWAAMMARCYGARNKFYANYGGRGIAVCERWHDYRLFIADLGPIPPGLSLDRVDNDGDYAPENVRLADDRTQSRNRRNTRFYTYGGRTLCLADWAREFGLTTFTLAGRLDAGWSLERALAEPVRRPTGVARLAEATGVPRSTLAYRIKRGVSVADLANRFGAPTYEYQGRTLTLVAWAAELGIDRRCLGQRLGRGWSVERAFTTPQAGGRREYGVRGKYRPLTCGGLTRTYAEWSALKGLPYRTITHRLWRGWTVEQALETPLGIKWDSGGEIKRLAEAAGTSRSAIQNRIKRGMTGDDLTRGDMRIPMVEFRGQSRSLKQWCLELGLKLGTIQRRIENGWPVEKALSTPVARRVPRRSGVPDARPAQQRLLFLAEEDASPPGPSPGLG